MTSAPERIYADMGPNGGWLYREEKRGDTAHEYIRSDIATHATLQVLIDSYEDPVIKNALTAAMEQTEVAKP